MKNKPATLDSLTQQIRDLIEDVSSKSLRIAELVRQAKENFFADSCLGWLEWTEKSFGFSRRYAFRLLRVSELVHHDALKCIDIIAECGTDFIKIETIAQIPFDRIPEFLKTCNPTSMDRDELRAAVRQFLNKPPISDRQTDFFNLISAFPDPQKLRERCRDKDFVRRIDADRWLSQGQVLVDLAYAKYLMDGNVDGIDAIRSQMLADVAAIDKAISKMK